MRSLLLNNTFVITLMTSALAKMCFRAKSKLQSSLVSTRRDCYLSLAGTTKSKIDLLSASCRKNLMQCRNTISCFKERSRDSV